MNINLVFDAQALAAPSSFRTAVQQVATTIGAAISNNITINISVGYGEIQGQVIPDYDAYGTTVSGNYIPYQTVRSALLGGTSADDTSSAGSLPNTPAIQGYSNIYVPAPQQKALGLFNGDPNAIDSAIGFATNTQNVFNGYFTILALDVITHAMGRYFINAPNLFSLVDFTSAGTRLFNSGSSAPPAYFSVDGGVTKLADFDQASDPSNFSPPPASSLTPNDPLNEGPKSTNTATYLTKTDLRMLDVIGYDLAKFTIAAAITAHASAQPNNWLPVADTSANISSGLATLQSFYAGGNLAGLTATDGATAYIQLTAAQATANQALLSTLTGPYSFAITLAGSFSSTFGGSQLALSLTGTGAANLTGNALANTFQIASVGFDTINGGNGRDTVDYSGLATTGIVATLQGGGGIVNKGGSNSNESLSSIEKIVGSTSGDVFYVDGAETVSGGGGFDYLIELTAGVNLTYGTHFTNISEFVTNVGTNTVDASSDPNILYLYGSTGTDTLTLGTGGGYLFSGGGTDNVLNGGANAVNILIDSGGSSTMNGGTGTATNYYYINGTNDTVHGAGAFNAVIYLTDNATYSTFAADAVQELILHGGTNVANGTGSSTFLYLYGAAGNDTLTTGAGGGYLIGEGGTNVLQGGGGTNVFIADNAAGIDSMNGGTGSNIYYIDANSAVHGAGAFNTVIELQQNVSLTLGSAQLGSNVQQVILNGGTNTVDFSTATASVYLYGGAGNDTIKGSTGNDFLYGGAGLNTFQFQQGWGQDVIGDWNSGSGNVINLDALAGLGVHALADITQSIQTLTVNGGSVQADVITSTHTATNSITLWSVSSALAAGNFHFA